MDVGTCFFSLSLSLTTYIVAVLAGVKLAKEPGLIIAKYTISLSSSTGLLLYLLESLGELSVCIQIMDHHNRSIRLVHIRKIFKKLIN